MNEPCLAEIAISTAGWVQGAIPPALLVALVAIIEIAAPGFLTGETLALLLANTAVLFILATGVTFVILLGGIDLSIQAVASLASVILAQLLPSLGLAAFPVAIAVRPRLRHAERHRPCPAARAVLRGDAGDRRRRRRHGAVGRRRPRHHHRGRRPR